MSNLLDSGATAGPILTREGRRTLAARADHLRHVVIPELRGLRQEPEHATEDEYQRAVHELSGLNALLARAGAVEDTPDDPRLVELGEAVTIALDDGHLERYLLVDPAEATLAGMRVSTGSPLGQALLGRRVGDQVEVLAPDGPYRCQVVSCERPGLAASPALLGSP